jgi:hypothetical protein
MMTWIWREGICEAPHQYCACPVLLIVYRARRLVTYYCTLVSCGSRMSEIFESACRLLYGLICKENHGNLSVDLSDLTRGLISFVSRGSSKRQTHFKDMFIVKTASVV